MAGLSRLILCLDPRDSLTAPEERKRMSSPLSEEKFDRKIKTDLTGQASPNYSFFPTFSQWVRQEMVWRDHWRLWWWSIGRRGFTRNGREGHSRVRRDWSHGFCNDLEHCVSNYGNKLTFGKGTRLTVTPSKYLILGQQISYSLISRWPM